MLILPKPSPILDCNLRPLGWWIQTQRISALGSTLVVSYIRPLGDLGILGMYANISQLGEEVIIILGRVDILLPLYFWECNWNWLCQFHLHSSKIKHQSSSLGQLICPVFEQQTFFGSLVFSEPRNDSVTHVSWDHVWTVTRRLELFAACSLLRAMPCWKL